MANYPNSDPAQKTNFNPNNTPAVEGHTALGHNNPNQEVNAIGEDIRDTFAAGTEASPDATAATLKARIGQILQQLKNIVGESDWYGSVAASIATIWSRLGAEHSSSGAHTTDSIAEKTADTGVTVDSLLIKDGTLPNHPFNSVYYQAIENGNFDIWRNGTSFSVNNTRTDLAEEWFGAVSNSPETWTYSRSTDVPLGSAFALKAVRDSDGEFMYISHIIRNVDTLKLSGQNVTLSFQAKTTSGKEITTLRAILYSFTGTADDPIATPISGFSTNADPTANVNWTKENEGSNISLTTAYKKFSIEDIAIDTVGITNLAVVFTVVDPNEATNDEFYLTQVQLSVESANIPFQPRRLKDENLIPLYAIPRARVRIQGDQTIVTGVGSLLLDWNVEIYDVGNCFDSDFGTKLTAPEDGLYVFSGHAVFSGIANNRVGARVMLNGSAYADYQAITSIEASNQTKSVVWYEEVIMLAGQYVEINIFQDSGSTEVLLSNRCFASFRKVAE